MNDKGIQNLRNNIVSQFNFPLSSIYTDWVIQQKEMIIVLNAIQQSIYNAYKVKK